MRLIKPCLFLDRDGVINKRLDNDYVKNVAEFKLIEGVQEAILNLSSLFYPIFVVTNQQGIGKRLMSHQDLLGVHKKMLEDLGQNLIHSIIYCPHLTQAQCACRKPKSGMLDSLINSYGIERRSSWMVGDSLSDIDAAANAGVKSCKVGEPNSKANLSVNSLLEFSKKIKPYLGD